MACRIDPEAGVDGRLDGLLQILFQIESPLTGMIETTGTDQRPVCPIETQQAGEKMGNTGIELEGVGGLDIGLQRHDLLRGLGQDQPVGCLDLNGHG